MGTESTETLIRDHTRRLRGAQAAMCAVAVGTFLMAGVTPWTIILGMGFLTHMLAHHAKARLLPRDTLLKIYSGQTPPLDDDDPLAQRVAALAQKLNVRQPAVFVSPFDIKRFSPLCVEHTQKRFTPLIVLPAGLFTATAEGRPALFTPDEQDAVIAHELVHLKNRNAIGFEIAGFYRKATLVAFVGAVLTAMAAAVPLTLPVLAAGLAGSALTMIELAARRRTEYLTDSMAVETTGKPEALASALEKLERLSDHIQMFDAHSHKVKYNADDARTVTFTARPVLPGTTTIKPGWLRAQFITHPLAAPRYKNICRTAFAMSAQAMPATPPSVDMDMILRRTQDDIILPPFAIPETLVRDKNMITVATTRPPIPPAP